MASEIQCVHTATGKNLYVLIRNSTGSVWDGSSLVGYATANLSSYAIALTEQGTASRYYAATFSASIASGVYNLAVYERQGASPAEGDPIAAVGQVEWNGSSVVALDTRASSSTALSNVTWTDAKAGYVDVAISSRGTGDATAANQTTIAAYVDELESRLTAARATNLDNLNATVSSRAAPGDAMDLVANAVDASALATDAANEIADALLDRSNGIETNYTLRQALRLILSALAAKLSGAATTTVAIRNVGDTKDRITATVDASGNRTAVTLDAT